MSAPRVSPPKTAPMTNQVAVRPNLWPRPASATGVICESIDCPQGDQVDRTAAANATVRPSTTTTEFTRTPPGPSPARQAYGAASARRRRTSSSRRRQAESPRAPYSSLMNSATALRRLVERTGVERRLRVVLDAELDALRVLVAGDARRQRESHVDARRHSGRGHDLALLHDAPTGRDRAVLLQPLERRPVRRRLLALEQPGRREQHRARAHRGRPRRWSRRSRGSIPAAPRRVSSARVANPPGTTSTSARVDLGERVVGDEREEPVVGADLARRLARRTSRSASGRRCSTS